MIWHKITQGMTPLEKITCVFIVLGVIANVINIWHHW